MSLSRDQVFSCGICKLGDNMANEMTDFGPHVLIDVGVPLRAYLPLRRIERMIWPTKWQIFNLSISRA